MNQDFPQSSKAPVAATWICLVLAWVFFLLPIPLVSLVVGSVLNIVAFILAIVVMVRGSTGKGLFPLLCSILVSPAVYFLGLAILGAAIIGSQDKYTDYVQRAQANSTTSHTTPAIQISARELYRAYQSNQAAADAAYKGKQLEVTGTIGHIESNLMDAPVISLEGGNDDPLAVSARGLGKEAAAGLSKGDTVTLKCTGAGELLGEPILEDCRL